MGRRLWSFMHWIIMCQLKCFICFLWIKILRTSTGNAYQNGPQLCNSLEPNGFFSHFQSCTHAAVAHCHHCCSSTYADTVSCQLSADIVLRYRCLFWHNEAEAKWPPLRRRYFEMHFLKTFELRIIFHWNVFFLKFIHAIPLFLLWGETKKTVADQDVLMMDLDPDLTRSNI